MSEFEDYFHNKALVSSATDASSRYTNPISVPPGEWELQLVEMGCIDTLDDTGALSIILVRGSDSPVGATGGITNLVDNYPIDPLEPGVVLRVKLLLHGGDKLYGRVRNTTVAYHFELDVWMRKVRRRG